MIRRLLENLYAEFKDFTFFSLKCPHCKTVQEKSTDCKLFLIPVFHGNTYKPSKEYYIKNCFPIDSTRVIPTGRRACRILYLTCPSCGNRRVLVEDFLKVRETEVVKNCNVYEPDADFSRLLAAAPLVSPQVGPRASGIHETFRNP